MRLILALLVPAALAAGHPAARADDGADPPRPAPVVVWCHDEARALVTRKRAGECTGREVSEDEARALRAARTRQIQERLRPAAPLIDGMKQAGRGTGFFVSAQGHVITNHHVIAECPGLSVTPADGEAVVATLVASDKANDLALLAARVAPPAFARFRGADRPTVGEEVLVAGYPLHGMVAIKPIFVAGQVAQAKVPVPAGRFPIRIDIRRGNSGSPVLDRAGRVIGVISSKINTPALYAATGQVVRDLGMAIGAAPLLDLLRNNAVTITAAPEAGALDGEALHDRAHQMVAQIGCWR